MQITALGKEIDKQIAAALKASKKGKQTAQESEKDIKLTGSFESNKGKLPVPITGTYLVAGDYVIQNVAGLKDVNSGKLANKTCPNQRVVYLKTEHVPTESCSAFDFFDTDSWGNVWESSAFEALKSFWE